MDVRTPEFQASPGENSILGAAGSCKPKYLDHSSTAGGMAALALFKASAPSTLPPRSPQSQAMYTAPPAMPTFVANLRWAVFKQNAHTSHFHLIVQLQGFSALLNRLDHTPFAMKIPVKLFLLGSVSAAFIALQWRAPTFSEESLKGMRVLVTGASTGIGEQVAYHYARMGAQIVITARREHVLKEVIKKCLDLGAQKALYIAADMAEIADADRVVEFAEEQLQGLDYVVLNHIGPSPYGMWDGDVDHIRWLMQVNFHSYVKMAVKALPALEKTNGSVMVVSSLLGKMCSPFALPYAATKFALNGFFGSLQHELAMKQSNVSITICTLGLIDTESAMEKIKGYIDMPAYPAHEAAYQIIKAGALRQNEAFYPWYTFYYTLFRDWFPYYRDQVIRKVYKYQP